VATILNSHNSDAIAMPRLARYNYTGAFQIWREDNLAVLRLIKPTGFDWGSFGTPVITSSLSGEGQIFPQSQYGIVNDMKVYITEIDFGPTPTYDASFIITDAAVSVANYILPTQAGIVATGRQLDEDEMDKLIMVAEAGAGQFILKVHSTTGPVAGKYKIGYQIGVL
jgi:hypothetical protein